MFNLIDEKPVSKKEVIAYKRKLGNNIEDIKHNIEPSPNEWRYGGLTEGQFLSLAFYRPELAVAREAKFILREVAKNYYQGHTEGIDESKIRWFRDRIKSGKPNCGYKPIQPLQLDGWVNNEAPGETRSLTNLSISDGYHRTLAYAMLLIKRRVNYQAVYAYVRPK